MLLGVRVDAGASGSLGSPSSGLCGPECCACSLPYSCFPCYASAFLSNNHLLTVAIVIHSMATAQWHLKNFAPVLPCVDIKSFICLVNIWVIWVSVVGQVLCRVLGHNPHFCVFTRMTKINQESVQSVIVIRSCPKKGGCQEVIQLLRQSTLQEVTLEDE